MEATRQNQKNTPINNKNYSCILNNREFILDYLRGNELDKKLEIAKHTCKKTYVISNIVYNNSDKILDKVD